MAELKELLVCIIEGCDQPALARRLCSAHYSYVRWRGLLADYPPVSTRRITTGIDYVRIWAPGHPLAMADGYVLEHRKVVYDSGVAVSRTDHVHHINGDKHDNRLENLEVKTASTHHSDHVREAGEVTNQFGTFAVCASTDERTKRSRDNWRRARVKKRSKA